MTPDPTHPCPRCARDRFSAKGVCLGCGYRPPGDEPGTTMEGIRYTADSTMQSTPVPTTGSTRRGRTSGESTGTRAALLAELASRSTMERYEIEDEVAHGGMATVLLANDIDMRRPVAMKVLLPSTRGEDEIRLRRFVEEAHITAQLQHPNIPPVHEMGVTADGRPFFTMKLVHGRSLHQILADIRTDPLVGAVEWPLARLLDVFTDICNAVAYAHSRGVVHRDLKPENIMVGSYGEVLVMDWGLAKNLNDTTDRIEADHGARVDDQLEQVIDGFRSDDDSEITVDGNIIGTPAYMAPEQAAGQIGSVDRLSDVYALGAVLYAICTLHKPIPGRVPKEIIARAAAGQWVPPEKRSRVRDVPPELTAVIAKAMAREKRQRYPSAVALRNDIDLFTDNRAVSVRPDSLWEGVRKFHRRNRAASTVAMVALVLFTIFFWSAFGLTLHLFQNEREARQDSQRQERQTRAAYHALVMEREARREAEAISHRFSAVRERLWRTIVEEGFGAGWRDRWSLSSGWDRQQPLAEDALVSTIEPLTGGGLRVRSGTNLHLVHQQTIAGDISMTVEATWHGGQEGGSHLILGGETWDEGYVFQLGGYGNTQSAIVVGDGKAARRLVSAPVILREGQRYRLTATLLHRTDHVQLSMLLDEEQILACTASATAPTPHSCAIFVGSHADVTLHGAEIAGLATPQQEDLLVTAQRLVMSGRFTAAQQLYADIAETAADGRRRQRAQQGREWSSDLESWRAAAPGWRRRLQQSWPQAAITVTVSGRGIEVELRDLPNGALEPLRAIPVHHLTIAGAPVIDLHPLADLPLETLHLDSLASASLAGLETCPLRSVTIAAAPRLTSLTGLPGGRMQTLRVSNAPHLQDIGALTGVGLRTIEFSRCPSLHDLGPLTGAPLVNVVLRQLGDFSDLAPIAAPTLRFLGLTRLSAVQDLRPLGTTALQGLSLARLPALRDLSPLRDLPIETFKCRRCPQLDELQPLVGSDLSLLDLQASSFADMTPFAGSTIGSLDLSACPQLQDLAGLTEVTVRALFLRDNPQLHSVAPLQQGATRVLDLRGSQRIQDLASLMQVPLHGLLLDCAVYEQQLITLRTHKDLGWIADSDGIPIAVDVFWRERDRIRSASQASTVVGDHRPLRKPEDR